VRNRGIGGRFSQGVRTYSSKSLKNSAGSKELSRFKLAQAALDYSPRPTHKRELLESVLKSAKKHPPDEWVEAAEALTFGPLAWEFQCEEWPAPEDPELFEKEAFFEKGWVKFAEVVLTILGQKESRHGSTQKAKHRLANELAFIFDAYAKPEHETDRERLRILFVATALTAVGVAKPGSAENCGISRALDSRANFPSRSR
jgi:hypothetical protein